MAELDFDQNINQELRGFMYPSKLKLRSNEIVYKLDKTGRVEHLTADDIIEAQWIVRARGYCLKLVLRSGSILRFDGFQESDFEKLSTFLQEHYSVMLARRDLSYKGWNWGKANFLGNNLEFEVDGHLAFELPLDCVSNATSNKNEVILEFHQNDDADICLMEMRFHLPTAGQENDDDQPADRDEGEITDDSSAYFLKQVLNKADIIQVTGDALCEFKEMQCLQPRGRYDFKLYATFLHLHGKTFDYKLPLSTIYRMFLLPHKDQRQMFFVLGVEPPIKHGQTRYHFIILTFDRHVDTSVELRLTEEEVSTKYEGKLQREMQGPEFEVVARLFKVLVGRKVTVPGNYRTNSGGQGISCGNKASLGYLYPLERGFIFVPKPALHLRFDEISHVNFRRGNSALKTFDFEIETKSGTSHTFTNIEKDEYQRLFDYVSGKKLSVKNLGESGTTYDKAWSDSGQESSDEDHDVYMVKMKAEGRQKAVEAAANMAVDEDDDDDDQDEDFVPIEVEEPEEEYYSEAASSSDEEAGAAENSDSEAESKKKKKKQKHKKEKKRREDDTPRRKRGAAGAKEKDANAPKRPSTAYFLFMNERRAQVKQEHPDASIGEVAKLIGAMWNQLSDAEKTKWNERYEAAKKTYDVDMKEYARKIEAGEIDAPTLSTAQKVKRSKLEKDPNAPKRPASAYILFSNEKRVKIKAENPSASVGDVAKLVGAMWSKISDEEKAKWNAKYEATKMQYEVNMKEYQRKLNSGEIAAPSKVASKPKSKSSPTKKGEADDLYKSKEYISSDSDSSSLSSDDEKETKKSKKVNVVVEKGKAEDSEEKEDLSAEDDESSEEEDAKPNRPKTRGSRMADGNESSDVGDLPSEEEILASPEKSDKSSSSSSGSSDEEDEDEAEDEDA